MLLYIHGIGATYLLPRPSWQMFDLRFQKIVIALYFWGVTGSLLFSQGDFSRTTVIQAKVSYLDMVYDRVRNLLYASDPNGNLVIIDPDDLAEVGTIAVGRLPSRLEISNDASRVYIGLDGDRAFRYFEPSTGTLGPTRLLFTNQSDPATAGDFAITPDDPTVVVVAKDTVGSSLDGVLEIFDDSGSIGESTEFTDNANSIEFVDPVTMFSQTRVVGGEIQRWSFTGTSLSAEQSVDDFPAGRQFEVNEGLVFFESGLIMDPFSLSALGSLPFNLNGAFEVFDGEFGTTFRLVQESLGGPIQLRRYDNGTFLLVDHVNFDATLFLADPTRLIRCGHNRLAYLRRGSGGGEIGVFSNVPTGQLPSIQPALILPIDLTTSIRQ